MAAGLRQQRGEATRSGILDVARRLFSDFGYHNTGIADIQDATGLTKGAFYHHFRAKQELGLAVLEAAREDYARQMIEPAMAEGTPGRRLAALLDCAGSLNETPGWRNCQLLATLCAEMTAADGALIEAVRGAQEHMFDTVVGLIEQAQASGEAAPGPANVWAQLLLSTMMGLLLIRKVGAARADHGDVMSQLKRAILPGLELPEKPEQESRVTARRQADLMDEGELY